MVPTQMENVSLNIPVKLSDDTRYLVSFDKCIIPVQLNGR